MEWKLARLDAKVIRPNLTKFNYCNKFSEGIIYYLFISLSVVTSFGLYSNHSCDRRATLHTRDALQVNRLIVIFGRNSTYFHY